MGRPDICPGLAGDPAEQGGRDPTTDREASFALPPEEVRVSRLVRGGGAGWDDPGTAGAAGAAGADAVAAAGVCPVVCADVDASGGVVVGWCCGVEQGCGLEGVAELV